MATCRTLRRGSPSRLTLTRFVGGGVAGARRAGVRRAGLAARRASAAAALATARSASSAERKSASAPSARSFSTCADQPVSPYNSFLGETRFMHGSPTMAAILRSSAGSRPKKFASQLRSAIACCVVIVWLQTHTSLTAGLLASVQGEEYSSRSLLRPAPPDSLIRPELTIQMPISTALAGSNDARAQQSAQKSNNSSELA